MEITRKVQSKSIAGIFLVKQKQPLKTYTSVRFKTICTL
jgi:hypothetical protein